MNDETRALVEAIISLKHEPSYIKDYIFPVATGLFSSLLGAGVAYLTIRHQDNSQIQKNRVQAINNWILCAEGAAQSLISMKQNYHGKLTSNPFQRAMEVRSLIGTTKKIDKDITVISFIVPRKDEPDTHDIKWRQLSLIRSMMQNYNLIIDTWNKREEIDRPIKEKLMKDYGELAYADVSKEQILSSVGVAKFTLLMDLTERAIRFTDDLIIELHDFLEHFPDIAKSLIKKQYRDRYGPIVVYSTGGNAILENLIEKSIEVDFSILAPLFGVTEEKLRAEYDTGY